MPTVRLLACELHVPADVKLRTITSERTKSSIEACALTPSLVPLPFSVSLRVTDYYAFKTGFAAYVFVDREQHVNGCWSGAGEGRGVFRGRQKTVDGRAVVVGDWRLGSEGIEVVPVDGAEEMSSQRRLHKSRKSKVATIEVVVLRTKRRETDLDSSYTLRDMRSDGYESEVDVEIARSDPLARAIAKEIRRSHRKKRRLPSPTPDSPTRFDSKQYSDTRRNPSTHDHHNPELLERIRSEQRIREFEKAIRKRSRSRRAYSIASSSSSTSSSGGRLPHDPVDALRHDLAALLPDIKGCKTRQGSPCGPETAKQPLPEPTPSPVEDNGAAAFASDAAANSAAAADGAPNWAAQSDWADSAEPSASKPTDEGEKNEEQNKRPRTKQSSKRAGTPSSDDEDSQSKESSNSNSSASDTEDASSSDSESSTASHSSTSDPPSPSQSHRRQRQTHNRKPHRLYRAHWHYHDTGHRSRPFGGTHAPPPYHAPHRVAPRFLDSLEQPYAVFKFRIADAQTLQTRYALEPADVAALRLRPREEARMVRVLGAEELRALVGMRQRGGVADADAAAAAAAAASGDAAGVVSETANVNVSAREHKRRTKQALREKKELRRRTRRMDAQQTTSHEPAGTQAKRDDCTAEKNVSYEEVGDW